MFDSNRHTSVRDQHRQRTTRDNTLPRLAAEPTLIRSVADADSVEGLDEALELLPAQQRRAVDLYYGSGFSTEEAATRMGISPGAFRFHLSRARRSLKPRMAEKLGRQELTPAGRPPTPRPRNRRNRDGRLCPVPTRPGAARRWGTPADEVARPLPSNRDAALG